MLNASAITSWFTIQTKCLHAPAPSERHHRIERVDGQRDQKHRLRSLEGRWGVRLVQAGGNAHQQTGETSGRRGWCWDVGGHGVDFAPGLINDSPQYTPTT